MQHPAVPQLLVRVLFASVLVVTSLEAQGKNTLRRSPALDYAWTGGFGSVGTDSGPRAWAVFDDGNGPSLYAAGDFRAAGDAVAPGIARWDGARWQPVTTLFDGGGVVGPVIRALAVFDDGSGPALYAGGDFNRIDGVQATDLARYDGQRWSAVPGNLQGFEVHALLSASDENGPALFVGGEFFRAGTVSARNVARWDGNVWSALGAGLPLQPVLALESFDAGSGPEIHAGTQPSAGSPALYRWSAAPNFNWTPLPGAPVGFVRDLEVYDAGTGAKLYAGGFHSGASGVPSPGVVAWDGSLWSALPGLNNGDVNALTRLATPSGEVLIVGGFFSSAAGQSALNIAAWDGAQWSPLGNPAGTDRAVRSAIAFDDGNGAALFIGGDFDQAGDGIATHVARWDGTSWRPLTPEQGGFNSPGLSSSVQALAKYDDGNGPALYAGGLIYAAGTTELSGLARWTDNGWTDVGGSLTPSGSAFQVHALLPYENGDGPVMAVGGFFGSVGGSVAAEQHRPLARRRLDRAGARYLGAGVRARDLRRWLHPRALRSRAFLASG